MTRLSLTAAWNETTAFVKREAQLAFLIAFLLVALPAAVMQALTGAAPGQTPVPTAWSLLYIPFGVISAIGSLAVSCLALRPGTTGGDALRLALRRVVPFILVILILILVGILLAIPLAAILIAAGGTLEGDLTGGAVLALLVWCALFVALWIRLVLMTPVTVAEPLGPVGIIRRSWELTGGHFWKLLGFFLLIILLLVVVMVAVGAVGGILIFFIAGQPEPGSLASFLVLLLGAVVNTAITVFLTGLVARIYVQLSAPAAPVSTSGI